MNKKNVKIVDIIDNNVFVVVEKQHEAQYNELRVELALANDASEIQLIQEQMNTLEQKIHNF